MPSSAPVPSTAAAVCRKRSGWPYSLQQQPHAPREQERDPSTRNTNQAARPLVEQRELQRIDTAT